MWVKVLTTAGITLLSRINNGRLVLTKAQAGAGQISDNQLVNAVAISQYKRDLVVTQITNKSSAIAIRLQLNNKGLNTAFDLHQIGIYAKIDGDASEVLMYIMQSDSAEYIPSATESPSYINDYVIQLNLSQASNISAVIDPVGLVTIGQLNNKLDDKVDKVSGKGLSANDYTTVEKTKLASVENNANNYAHPSTHPYSMITGAPTSLPANGGTAANVPWTGVTGKPSTFPATVHTHDDRYYTEAQTDILLTGKASTATSTTSENGLMSKEDKAKLYETSNLNILDNSDFRIWQRGENFDVKNNWFYAADRWCCYGSGLVGIHADGLAIGSSSKNIRQYFEDAVYSKIQEKTVTLSYSQNDVIYTRTFILQNNYINLVGAKGDVFNWAKLELGSTATPYVPPDPATELMKCKRYYEKAIYMVPLFQIQTQTMSTGQIRFSVKKRVPPTIKTILADGTSGDEIAHWQPNRTGNIGGINVKITVRTPDTNYVGVTLANTADFISGSGSLIGMYIADAEIYS